MTVSEQLEARIQTFMAEHEVCPKFILLGYRSWDFFIQMKWLDPDPQTATQTFMGIPVYTGNIDGIHLGEPNV